MLAATPAGPQVLVIGALTPAGNNAARRAALLAREHGWALRILHAEREARLLPAAREALDQLCGPLQARLGIAVAGEVVAGDLLRHVVQQAPAAQLAVIGTSRDNALKEKVAGVPMDRLVRLCRVPTLVVKRTVDAAFAQGTVEARNGGRYERVLACVDLEPGAPATVAAASAIAPAARLEAFHAVSARAPRVGPLAGAQPGSETVLGRARSALAELLAQAGMGSIETSVGFGTPVDAVLGRQRAVGAELMVIGKRQRGLLADFFLGDVTREVLAGSTADVLVLPGSRGRAAVAAPSGTRSPQPLEPGQAPQPTADP